MTAPTNWLISGAKLANGETTNIAIENGTVTSIGQPATAPAGAREIDANGLIALPGLVDLHAHFREPGYEQSETVLTGSMAAAKGGYTGVFTMANSLPVADTASVVEQVKALGDHAGYVTVQPIGAVTKGLAGQELAELGAMAESSARVRVFSDDGMCVHDPLLMRRALEYVRTWNGVIAQHAQEPRLTEGAQMNESDLSGELGLAGWPAVAEEAIIARDVLLTKHVDSRLHVCHVSTAGSVEVIRWAKKMGVRVTAEVTPHHLLLTEELVRGYDARFKVNPPLRAAEDVQALREAVADGTIDIIATDHAPHPEEAKCCAWAEAANGMVGLESALSVAQLALVNEGHTDWAGIERLMSTAPARIGDLSHHGRIAEGERANITLYDPSALAEFTVESLGGKSRNTPYRGRELPGSVRWTLHEGVATLRDGVLAGPEEVRTERAEARA